MKTKYINLEIFTLFPSFLETKNLQNHAFFEFRIFNFSFWRNFDSKKKNTEGNRAQVRSCVFSNTKQKKDSLCVSLTSFIRETSAVLLRGENALAFLASDKLIAITSAGDFGLRDSDMTSTAAVMTFWGVALLLFMVLVLGNSLSKSVRDETVFQILLSVPSLILVSISR